MSLSWEGRERGEVGLLRALRACDGDLAAVVDCWAGEMDPTCHALEGVGGCLVEAKSGLDLCQSGLCQGDESIMGPGGGHALS